MKCIWTPFAQKELRKVLDYLIENFGVSSSIEYLNKVEQWDAWISENPTMARLEPLLAHCTEHAYRSMVIRPYSKIILFEDSRGVFIIDIWDMRRNPTKLVNRISDKKQ